METFCGTKTILQRVIVPIEKNVLSHSKFG
jgi:hypothetical protein